MTDFQHNSSEVIPRRRIATAGLLAWMLGMMLLGWFVLDGPGISSIVKRVAPLKRAQQALRCALGEPVKPTPDSHGNPQP